jgi:REP element-mobilizing transposase RayT
MPRSYRIVSGEGYAYFVTCTVVEHLPIFSRPNYVQIVLDSLAYLREHKNTQLNAFVLMSTHLHAVLWPQNGANMSDVLRDFKRHTSRAISREAQHLGDSQFLQTFAAVRAGNRARPESQYQVWQEGSHPEAIYSDDFARQKIEYIHFNPVKAGLVAKPEDWPHSSARAYELRQTTYPPTDIMPLW